jgi:uncharacterized paraquat-inducible protein A
MGEQGEVEYIPTYTDWYYTCQCGYFFGAVTIQQALDDNPCPRCSTPISHSRRAVIRKELWQ